jgi:hypothetical protein
LIIEIIVASTVFIISGDNACAAKDFTNASGVSFEASILGCRFSGILWMSFLAMDNEADLCPRP